ncbi:MAG: hypothetical protein AB7Q17_15545 [Phycisphaerae bacterium]
MPHRAAACGACGREFATGDAFVVYLYDAPLDSPVDRDSASDAESSGDAPVEASARASFAGKAGIPPVGYDRADRCPSCPPPAGHTPLATWRTQRPAPAGKPRSTFDAAAVYEFFARLDPQEDPRKVQFRFLLALILWRKKVLKLDGASTDADGREWWRFAVPRSDDRHDVERPEVDEAQLDELSAPLEQLLAGGALALPEVSDRA